MQGFDITTCMRCDAMLEDAHDWMYYCKGAGGYTNNT